MASTEAAVPVVAILSPLRQSVLGLCPLACFHVSYHSVAIEEMSSLVERAHEMDRRTTARSLRWNRRAVRILRPVSKRLGAAFEALDPGIRTLNQSISLYLSVGTSGRVQITAN